MCRILLSINPEHVKHILDGSKEYEFRKVRCKKEVDRIVIYSTAPDKKVVAEADVETVIDDSPSVVWEITQHKAGISKRYFFNYFQGNERAIAYKLTNLNIFDKPRSLSDYSVSTPPQSFIYV